MTSNPIDYSTVPSDCLAGFAREDEGQCRHPTTFRTRVGDFDRRYEPALPLDLVRSLPERTGPDSPEQCAAWLAEEGRMSDAAGCRQPGYYADLAKWWLADPAQLPITVSLHDGLYQIWGGWHRHAIAVANGLETIPALIGVPREKGVAPPRSFTEAVWGEPARRRPGPPAV